MAEAPIRKHVNISARDSAQLELRLHWFARALAEREGYIVALLRRPNASGRQVATVSYELHLPRLAKPAPPAGGRRMGLPQAVPRVREERARAASASSGNM
jgi:hypothetical protein